MTDREQSPKGNSYEAKFSVNLDALYATLANELRQVIEVVSLGLRGAEEMEAHKNELPDVFFHYSAGPDSPPDLDELKQRFHSWAVLGGLRDCAEAFKSYVDKCREVCFIYSLYGQGSFKVQEWNAGMVEEGRRFHKLGLPDKFQYLGDRFGVHLPGAAVTQIKSINKARNCMAHRAGVVSEADTNNGASLTVEWKKGELFVEREGREIEIGPENPKLNKGETLMLRFVDSAKSFAIGEQVIFSTQEFSQICLTLDLCGKELLRAIFDFAKSKGVPFGDVNPPAEE